MSSFHQRSKWFVASVIELLWMGLVGFHAYGTEPTLVTFSGATMGTRYSVTATHDDPAELQKLVDDCLAQINKQMSTYDPDSELSRFNAHRSNDWFAVSKETARVIDFALQVAAETDGAFDPTVGPAVNLWGFGPDKRRKSPPSDAEIEAVKKRIGYQSIEVRLDPPSVKKLLPEIYVDLSAVAKGYAVDKISDLLAARGCTASLVVIGGEVRTRGTKPDGTPWKIAVEEPDSQGREFSRILELANQAVSTSGDWRNSFMFQNQRYSHVIDPMTARPVNHNLASVTVIADRSIKSDAWSTALMVMGETRGRKWCDEHGVTTIFFVRGDNGEIVARPTSRAEKNFAP